MSNDLKEQYEKDCEALADVPGKAAWMVWKESNTYIYPKYKKCKAAINPDHIRGLAYQRIPEADQLIAEWVAEQEKPIAQERHFDKFSLQMQEDEELQWSWHCNIAMSAYDEGLDLPASNRAAARFMKICFDVDTTKNQHFKQTQPQPDKSCSGKCLKDKKHSMTPCSKCDEWVAEHEVGPNYDKEMFGAWMNSRGQTPVTDTCHNYGSFSGCDYHCPALLNGDCKEPEWILEDDDENITIEQHNELLELYGLSQTQPDKCAGCRHDYEPKDGGECPGKLGFGTTTGSRNDGGINLDSSNSGVESKRTAPYEQYIYNRLTRS